MGSPQLQSLVRIRQLKEEAPARAEIDALIRSGNARLKDAQLQSLSLDRRFGLAYNAAHAFSLGTLRWYGYRSESRYIVFHCLEHTVKLPPAQWRILDQARASEPSRNTKATWTLIEASWKRRSELHRNSRRVF